MAGLEELMMLDVNVMGINDSLPRSLNNSVRKIARTNRHLASTSVPRSRQPKGSLAIAQIQQREWAS